MSNPAGMPIEGFDEKPVLVTAFLAALLGSACFAARPTCAMALFSLFTIGLGMAVVAIEVVQPCDGGLTT